MSPHHPPPRKPLPLIGLALALLFTWSCSKDPDTFDDLPNNNGEWLLPLVQGDASLLQLSQLQVIPLTATINSSDLGFEPGPYDEIPAFSVPSVGPFPIAVWEYLEVMEIGISEVTVRLNNPFPITISSGTRLVLRNEANTSDPNNVVLDIAIDPDLVPGGQYESTTEVQNVDVTDTLYAYFEQLSSPGGTDLVFDGSDAVLEVTLSQVLVDRLSVDAGISFERRDSLALEIDTSLQNDTDAVAGHIVVYADNGLPVNASFQGYLYDDADVLVDSLFDAPFEIMGGQTDPTGATTSMITSSDTIPVDASTLAGFLRSRKIELVYGVNTLGYPGPSVSANADASLRLQLVGDLRLNISYSDFE
jgi:hypothetical protein